MYGETGKPVFFIVMEFKTSNLQQNINKTTHSVVNMKEIINSLNNSISNCNNLDEIQNLTIEYTKANTTQINNNFLPKYWWNKDIEMAIKRKHQIIRNYHMKSSTSNLINLNKQTALVKKLIKKAKRIKNAEWIATINPKTPITEVWKIIRILNNTISKKKSFNLIANRKQKLKSF